MVAGASFANCNSGNATVSADVGVNYGASTEVVVKGTD